MATVERGKRQGMRMAIVSASSVAASRWCLELGPFHLCWLPAGIRKSMKSEIITKEFNEYVYSKMRLLRISWHQAILCTCDHAQAVFCRRNLQRFHQVKSALCISFRIFKPLKFSLVPACPAHVRANLLHPSSVRSTVSHIQNRSRALSI